MSGLLDGRRVMVSGAARGIGRAVAERLTQQGAAVAVADIDAGLARQTAQALGPTALALTLDIGNDDSVRAAVAELSARWDGLDGLVNNAAVLDENPTQTIPLARWDRILNINLTGALRLSQAALPLLAHGTCPAIVNTVSTQALYGQPNSVAYATAKGGLLNLTRCMAIDLAPQGLRVNAVAPGFIDTRMALLADGSHEHASADFKHVYLGERKIPLARPGTAQDCAGAFLFLLSDLSLYITGQVIAVDGGLTATY